MNSILLIGSGGHARSLIDLIETSSHWDIYGLVGLASQVGSSVFGYPVLGCDSMLPQLRSECSAALLAIGHLADSSRREHLAANLSTLGFHSPTIVSRHAIVSKHARFGLGTVLCHGAIVNAGSFIGDHCIINSRALIEHDVHISDHCHISTGALVNGGVRIGAGSFVGSGSILREGLDLPAKSVISAGKRVMGWPLTK
jgi:sugar O-acyltransferase (sialic acid O-acetyltransferase NeuD family)